MKATQALECGDYKALHVVTIPDPEPQEGTFMAQRAHSQITYLRAGHLSMITQLLAVADVIKRAARSTS
jgi:hypothetical protein